MKSARLFCFLICLVFCNALARPLAGQVQVSGKPLRPTLLPPGSMSSDGIIRLEDVANLSPEMQRATDEMRKANYADALRTFRTLQETAPLDPLPLRGEVQIAYRQDTLPQTVERFRSLLAKAPKGSKKEAVIQYALGDALMYIRIGRTIPPTYPDLGTEAGEHLRQAVRLDPDLLVAHLALAFYCENDTICKGTAARREYDAAAALRPDLSLQIRLLHALTWDRPGLVMPQELARLKSQGYVVPDDRHKMPEKTIAECRALIRDNPEFIPAYERIASDLDWPLCKKEEAAKYRALAQAIRDRNKK